MNTFLKGLSIFGMLLSVVMAVWDFNTGQYVWGILMVGCFFLNLNTFRSTTR